MTRVRYRYLDTTQGQLHARQYGNGEPVVLLHLTPGSGAQFDHVMPELADRGYQCWAIDALGNGRSAPLPEDYRFEIAAQAIGEAINDAGIAPTKIVAGHMTAQMAVELVANHSDIATHLVIDGLPMWDRPTREKIISLFDNTAPEASEDGSHVLEAWRRAMHLHKAWNPDLTVDANSEPRLRRALIDSLEQGMDMARGATAFLEFDVEPRLKELTLPTLVTTATADTLHDQHAATMAALPDAAEHVFQGTHPRHVVERAGEYADVLASFFGR